MKQHCSPGFTLVELLVVIAIVVILAAILFPVIERAQMRGKQATCQSNLKQLAIATMIYSEDNGGRLPSRDPAFFTGLKPYLKSQAVYVCPSQLEPRAFSDSVTKSFPSSYAQNAYLYENGQKGVIATTMRKLSKIVLMADVSRDRGEWHFHNGQKDDIDTRHQDMANASYCDGHTQALNQAAVNALELAPSKIP